MHLRGILGSRMVGLKNRWGDLLEDEEELPPTTTTGPDGKGIVVRVEYSRNDKGDVIKKTTRTKVVKIEKKVYKVRTASEWVKSTYACQNAARSTAWRC